MLEYNKIINADCLDVLKTLPDKCIDLVVTDPPYLIKNTKAGGKSNLAKSIQNMNDEIKNQNLTNGVTLDFCKECIRVLKKINMYIWCNKAQILDYLKLFVDEYRCSFDILCWQKDNAMPTFHNKYLSDKEYCLYFRKGGYCQPNNYNDAKTVWNLPINIKDKKLYNHPTIKPLSIIETLIKNSSKQHETVLDCFMGSGTTAIACINTKRNYICIEKDKEYYEKAKQRVKEHQYQYSFI